jgi:hypothetical protein
MANQITITNIRPPVGQTSRYANQTVIYWGPQNQMTFDTYRRGRYPTSPKDRYMVIPKGREYRPDLVAYEEYGVVNFWWRILEANGMKDVYDFQAGKNIRLPSNIF